MARSRRSRRKEDDPQTGRVVVLALLIAFTFILFCVVVWLAVRKRHEGEKKAAVPPAGSYGCRVEVAGWGRHSCLPPTWRGRQECLPHPENNSRDAYQKWFRPPGCPG